MLSDAAAGKGGALMVQGGPGIGKTALLQAALDGVPALRVLRAVGSQYEMELPFATLHQLLFPLLTMLGDLPGVQARAVRVALGMESGGPATTPLISFGVHSLLAVAGGETPLVCAVDDAHWADRASAEVLGLVVRRLARLPVAFVATVRDPVPAFAGLPVLRLPGLTPEESRALLNGHLRTPIDPSVRDRIVAEAQGNPLALLEFPTAGAGGFRIPLGGRLPQTLEAGFQRRLAALSPGARRFARLAAADPTGDPALVRRAADTLGLPRSAIAEVEATGLIEVGSPVRFRHPLVRSALYEDAGPGERRMLHAALGEATDAGVDPDRRAWHAAQAATSPNPWLATELERLAARAHARGGLAASAAFLKRAAMLTPSRRLRARRLLAAAHEHREMGDRAAALDLVALAEDAHSDEALRAETSVLRARVLFDRARNEGAVRALIAAARRVGPVDPVLGRDVLLDALAAVTFLGRFADAQLLPELAAEVRALPAPEGRERPVDLLLNALVTRVEHGGWPDPAVLGPAIDAYVRDVRDGARQFGLGELWLVCSAAEDVWDDAHFLEVAERQLHYARDSGAVVSLPVALSYQALAHVHQGRFDEAQRLVDEAYGVSADIGAPHMVYVDVTVAGWRGDEARVHRLSESAVRDAAARGEGRLLTAVEYANAVLFNGLGRYADAADACQTSARLDEPSFPPWVFPEYVEAAARSGRLAEAREVVVRLERRAAELDSEWCTGAALCARALVTDDLAAADLYREAIARLARTRGRIRLGRARLLYGEWLRRNGRRRQAVTELTAARALFSEMGAHAFVARTDRELLAAAPGRRTTGLSEREDVVARLVAGGATSREVAAALQISPRTVDAHLRKVFTKLGITSRRQLRDRYPAGG
ncbi:DNA-binding CsgD family transcriptional regulator [Catenuloplanes atrovinosus]|uniref:DNA-binding CsgD family transcriptional regulator n=1 Tax=Catenuloplanes atrovinosus TaxID=137266 RepID=A0AAE3YQB2_9ACTN|nr:DNA-binding CsgD family transcriptional regulator [Catenuloplanes atrovinosus]